MSGRLPSEIGPNTPLRLAEAAKIAFPSGGMTVSGLRREIARGRLAVEIIAGKQFTTLADIEEMRSQCRVRARVPVYTFGPNGATKEVASRNALPGSSETGIGMSSQDALRLRLKRQNSS